MSRGAYFLARTENTEGTEYHPSVIAWRYKRSAISERSAQISYNRWLAIQGDSTLWVQAPGME